MIHSTLSLRDVDECSPQPPSPQSPPRSSHRSRSFSTASPSVSVGGSSQVITRSRRLAFSGTRISWWAYSPLRRADVALPLVHPSAWFRLSVLVRADTLPSPYCACSVPGPLVLSAGNRAGASSHASGLTALAIKRALANAGRSRCAGAASINRAATPATAGDAMLVPLMET